MPQSLVILPYVVAVIWSIGNNSINRNWLLYFNSEQYTAQQQLIMGIICLITRSYVHLVKLRGNQLMWIFSNSVRN
jgi:hypothetical protein